MKERQHVFVVKFYKHFLDISRMHISTYVYQFIELHFEFPHFYRDQVLGKNAFTVKVWFRDYYLYTVSPTQCVTSRTITWLRTFSMVLPKIALFINLNKFFWN